jgi:hypothetical protein
MSSARLRGPGAGAAAGLLLGAAVFVLLSSASSTSGSRGAGGLSWPRPADGPPAGWVSATTASRSATLFYPAGWKPISGDRGTVSVGQRDLHGRYRAYLNVTPRQGAESLAGWAAFRTTRNRGEGDRGVREVAAAENLGFAHARGSCVIDDYLSRVGANPYRELACMVAGRGHTDVFVGAALRGEWSKLGPVIERAASALVER